jgi:hypothetical protein
MTSTDGSRRALLDAARPERAASCVLSGNPEKSVNALCFVILFVLFVCLFVCAENRFV